MKISKSQKINYKKEIYAHLYDDYEKFNYSYNQKYIYGHRLNHKLTDKGIYNQEINNYNYNLVTIENLKLLLKNILPESCIKRILSFDCKPKIPISASNRCQNTYKKKCKCEECVKQLQLTAIKY